MTTSEVIAFIRGLARESEHLQLFKDPACWSVPEFLILRLPSSSPKQLSQHDENTSMKLYFEILIPSKMKHFGKVLVLLFALSWTTGKPVNDFVEWNEESRDWDEDWKDDVEDGGGYTLQGIKT